MHLFTAGPAQTPRKILEALSLPTLHHRSEEFLTLFQSCKDKLHSIISLPHLFCLCSSGSGGMESAITSFSPRKILVLNHGKFSHRWLEIAHCFNIPSYNFEIPPYQAHNPQEVLEWLKKDPLIDCICMQSCESTGGVRQNFEAIANAVKSHNPEILVCVDGIASFAIEPIDTSHIDIFIASSQKALMLPAGLSFVFLSSYAFSLLKSKKPKSFYLALQNYILNEIAFSFPSNIFQALNLALSSIDPQTNYKLIKKRFLRFIAMLAQYDIDLFPLNPSYGIIAFKDQNEQIKNQLKSKQILISGGQGNLKNQISRIGNFGILQDFDFLLDSFESILKTR